MPVIIVLFTTRIGAVILAEAGLSFLGLGVPPPALPGEACLAVVEGPICTCSHGWLWRLGYV